MVGMAAYLRSVCLEAIDVLSQLTYGYQVSGLVITNNTSQSILNCNRISADSPDY